MGLDMYLEAKLHLPPCSEELARVRHVIGQAIGYAPPKEKPGDDATLLEITDVTVRVGYWRSLDPLHQWFVNNSQETRDDCRPAHIAPDVLDVLEQQLDRVSDDPDSASEHFVSEGDERMTESDIDYTLRIVVQARKLQERGWDIYYRASW